MLLKLNPMTLIAPPDKTPLATGNRLGGHHDGGGSYFQVILTMIRVWLMCKNSQGTQSAQISL